MCGGPVGDVLDTTSSVIGTDGGGGGILGAVEDVGESVGSGLADVDEFVNEEIPGGWVTVGLAAATVGAAAGAGAGAGTGSSLLGPTYGELGLTGVESGLAGPTYGELGLTGLELGTEASTGAPIFDYSQEVILSPGGNYIPATTLPSEIAGLDAEILKAGEAAIKAAPSISPSQAVNALRGASGLLGGQQTTPAGATQQFRGSTVPQGAVDYSGILNLLQTRSPQRNPYSLLG